jgi:peptidyl-prolyl cis-trans isomerase D
VYRKQDAEHRFKEISDKLEQTSFESPNSLDAAAKATGLAVQTSDWFTREAGTGIASQPPVRQAAFSEEVRQNGENSRPLPAGANHVVVVRKAEYEAPRPRSLEEVSATIKDELKLDGARARAAADAKAVQDAVAAGKTLQAAAAEKKAEFKDAGAVRRSATGIEPKILESAFRMPRPAAGKAQVEQVKLASGDVAVVALTAVQDAEWTAAPDADRQKESARLRDAVAGAEFSAYREDLKKRMDVKIVNPPTADTDPAS